MVQLIQKKQSFPFCCTEQYLIKANNVIGKFRRELAPDIIPEFDKIYPTVMTRVFSAHLDNDKYFARNILIIITEVAADRKSKIKTKQILKKLDVIQQSARDKFFQGMPENRTCPTAFYI